MIYQAHVMGWYRATFVVSNETIKWSLPTGYCLSRKWSDLKYVLPTRNLLIFADGSTIPLRFGPTSFGEIPRGDMLSLFNICGESSLVAQAYLESKFFAPAKRSQFDFLKLLLVSFGFCTGLMAIILYLALQETKPTLLQIGGIVVLLFTPIFYLAILHTIKGVRIERCYGPPKDFRRVPWYRLHRQ